VATVQDAVNEKLVCTHNARVANEPFSTRAEALHEHVLHTGEGEKGVGGCNQVRAMGDATREAREG
jgi:hypothetical protein